MGFLLNAFRNSLKNPKLALSLLRAIVDELKTNPAEVASLPLGAKWRVLAQTNPAAAVKLLDRVVSFAEEEPAFIANAIAIYFTPSAPQSAVAGRVLKTRMLTASIRRRR